MSWIKTKSRNLLIQIFICIAILELIGLWQKSTEYFWENRYLFYSKDAVRDIQPGLWTYQPNQQIRFVATYALPKSNPWVEYDCEFKTNSLGLIDTNYDDNKKADWLVLGDSFTEGHGGCPWLTRQAIQRSDISRETIINGGLAGAGILGFEKLLQFLESQEININNVLVVAISNDFKRGLPPINMWTNQKKCLVDLNCNKDDYWWAINKDESPISIISTTKGRANDRGNQEEWWAALNYYSFTYRIIQKLNWTIYNRSASFNKPTGEIYEQNFRALERIRQKYPNMKLILVPQRDEVGIAGHKNLDTQAAEDFLKSNSIPYSTCELSIADYMPIDVHPNSNGYAKLFKCVENSVMSK